MHAQIFDAAPTIGTGRGRITRQVVIVPGSVIHRVGKSEIGNGG